MAVPSSVEVTQLLLAWSQGEPAALEKLVPLVHAELSRLAHHYMAGERTGHTLQTTALVNEAFLRLVDSSQVRWQNRAHFMAVSAQLMRRILVDFARSRNYLKRGAGAQQVRRTGRPYALEPMTSAERKIVHTKVQELGGLATASEGLEPNR